MGISSPRMVAQGQTLAWSPRLTSPMTWAEGAQPTRQEGSWWPHWREWIQSKSGELKTAPTKLGSRKHRPLASAPGTYVMER